VETLGAAGVSLRASLCPKKKDHCRFKRCEKKHALARRELREAMKVGRSDAKFENDTNYVRPHN
jgi:hypothetical protein